MSDWKGTAGRRFVVAYSVYGILVVLVSIIIYIIIENVKIILFAVVVSSPHWMVSIPTYYHLQPVWSSVFIDSKKKQDVIIERIEAGLKDGDMDFTRTDTVKLGSKRTVLELLDLRPMEIVVDRLPVRSRVYMGPVEDGNEAEVERLKGLIDGALG